MNTYTAIVFGGSSGIGEAAAKKLSSAGYRVIIVGRDKTKLEEARKRIGTNIETASVDGTDRAAVDNFFKEIGTFKHLVLSLSGGKGSGAFKSVNIEDIRNGMEKKFFAQITVAQSALNYLEHGGSLTFITAGSARSVIPGTAGLAAINGAIEVMIPILAKELAPARVNAVSPGIVDTPWWDNAPKEFKEMVFKQTAAQLPVGRIGKPEDAAKAIMYLIDNTYVTGTVLEVDGGGHLG